MRMSSAARAPVEHRPLPRGGDGAERFRRIHRDRLVGPFEDGKIGIMVGIETDMCGLTRNSRLRQERLDAQLLVVAIAIGPSSEERPVGEACVITGRKRGS